MIQSAELSDLHTVAAEFAARGTRLVVSATFFISPVSVSGSDSE